MYVIENKNTTPQFNLALEECLCLRAMDDGSKFFMLWQNEPSIIVGRFQNTLEEIDSNFVREHGIHLVRRNSGGGAVYHDLGNINYSFIMPDSDALSAHSSGNLDFAFFTEPIIQALAELGVKAESTGRNDLSIEGKKISGGAQFRRGGITLHHGTLLYDTDLDVLSQALRPSEDKFQSKAMKSVRSRVCNIKPYLSEPLPVSGFQERLTHGIKNLTPMTLDALTLNEAERLAREKYSTWEWNYGESPRFTERKKKRFPWGGIEALLLVNEGRIVDCTFYGDYFGNGNYASLLSRLAGIPYTKEHIANALAEFGNESSEVFVGSKLEDIVDLLTP